MGENYYSAEDLARLRAVDPLFDLNTRRYRTRGQPCSAGEVLGVDGDGPARRCHFVERPLGNIYEQGHRKVDEAVKILLTANSGEERLAMKSRFFVSAPMDSWNGAKGRSTLRLPCLIPQGNRKVERLG